MMKMTFKQDQAIPLANNFVMSYFGLFCLCNKAIKHICIDNVWLYLRSTKDASHLHFKPPKSATEIKDPSDDFKDTDIAHDINVTEETFPFDDSSNEPRSPLLLLQVISCYPGKLTWTRNSLWQIQSLVRGTMSIFFHVFALIIHCWQNRQWHHLMHLRLSWLKHSASQ